MEQGQTQVESETVRELMTPHPVTVAPAANLSGAAELMHERRFRHLPVTSEAGDVVGIVSQRDLRAAISACTAAGVDPRAVQVSSLMQAPVDAVHADDLASDAGRHMLAHKRGCVVVVDGAGALVGILTEADFVREYVRRVSD